MRALVVVRLAWSYKTLRQIHGRQVVVLLQDLVNGSLDGLGTPLEAGQPS